MEAKSKQHLEAFCPSIERLDSATAAELSLFDAGRGFENFNDYIRIPANGPSEAMEERDAGKGTTHLIWNYLSDESRELVAYFTLTVNAIPYDDGIEDEGDGPAGFSDFPSISVLEIKMFAVSVRYQDIFFRSGGTDLPVSAWCLKAIIDYADWLSSACAGFQALFLHAIPSAEQFYRTNGFSEIPGAARPLYSLDQDFQAMWLPIRECLLASL